MNALTRKPSVKIVHGKATTTSLKIAEYFGKEHYRVIRSIENLDCSPEFRLANFGASSYINAQKKTQPMYTITKDGFMFLAMGFTGKEAAQWKEKYIEAFNQLEQHALEKAAARRMPKALPHFITPAQQNTLQRIVAQRAGESGGIRAYLWSRFNNHFQLGSYKQLAAGRFDEACVYLETMPAKEDKRPALPPPAKTSRYHYPRTMLDQPHFVWPATGKATLHLSMLANTTQYVSPLMSLLNQLRSEGHEVTAAFDEAVAMRAALQQANQALDDISTLALKARIGRVE